MSYDTLTATVPYAFGKGQEILFSYPSGRTADDYRSEGAVLIVGTGTLRQGAEAFFATYGASNIRVYYNGPQQSSGSVTLKAPLSVEAGLISGSSVGLANFRPDNLKKWRKALANTRRGAANTKLAFVGNSVTRGTGAASGSAQQAAAYPSQLPAMLSGYGITASWQSLFGTSGETGKDARLAMTGGFAGSANPTVGGNTFNASATGTWAFTPVGQVDKFDLWVYDNAANSLTYQIDGGAATTVTNSGPFAVKKVSISTTLGSHTLTVNWASGLVRVIGCHAYDSSTKEVALWNWGVYGSKASDAIISGGTNAPYYPLECLGTLAPDLSIIQHGSTEMRTVGVTVADYKAAMRTLIAACQASGDVILCTPVPSSTAQASQATQQSYVDAVVALAGEYDLPLIDFWSRWSGDYTTYNSLGFYSDSLHPIDVGYADMAQLVAGALVI